MRDLYRVIFMGTILLVSGCERTYKYSEIYSIKGDNIELKDGPGDEFEGIIDKVSTKTLHRKIYATIDSKVKVVEAETRFGWSKIIVISPDGLYDSHRGWIKSSHIIKSMAISSDAGKVSLDEKTNYINPGKIKLFNNVKGLQQALSKNGIGSFRKWRGDEVGWISATEYFSFGSFSKDNGMENNLAYYLEGDTEDKVQTIKLILNINNENQRTQALSLFKKVIDRTFASINLKKPVGLSKALAKPIDFKSTSEIYNTSLKLDRSNIDTWKFTIEIN